MQGYLGKVMASVNRAVNKSRGQSVRKIRASKSVALHRFNCAIKMRRRLRPIKKAVRFKSVRLGKIVVLKVIAAHAKIHANRNAVASR